MIAIHVVYLGFALGAGLVFLVLPVRAAILAVFLGGWLLLPSGAFPGGLAQMAWLDFNSLALPSDMMLTKAWVAPTVALGWALLLGRSAMRLPRPGLADLALLLWCLWPLIAAPHTAAADPEPWRSSLYLAASWGAAYALGRLWFADAAARVTLLKGLALAGVACLPIAVLEGTTLPWVHRLWYEPNTFFDASAPRTFGFRPVGFFEEGNQYGIWTALCAVAALWVAARPDLPGTVRLGWGLVALVTLGIVVAHQSLGGVLLMLAAVLLLVVWRWRIVMPALVLGSLALAALFGALVSGPLLETLVARGAIPAEALLRGIPAQGFRAMLDSYGVETLASRIRTYWLLREPMLAHPLWGSGVWDWYRPVGLRPDGLWPLILGHFGTVATALALAVGLAALLPALWRARAQPVRPEAAAAVPLALVVLMAWVDALLNAGIFHPAILIAGALAARPAPASVRDGPAADQSLRARPG